MDTLIKMKVPGWNINLISSGYLKPVSTSVVVTGLGWLLYEVNATVNTFRTLTFVIKRGGSKYIHIDEKLTRGMVVGKDGILDYHLGIQRFTSWLHYTRSQFAWKVLHLAQSDDPQLRYQAISYLASVRYLSESEQYQLAQALDPHTAVGLARTHGSSTGFFRKFHQYRINEEEEMTEEMRNILYTLNKDSKHLCVKYFLSKAFPEYEKQSNYLLDSEVMLTEPWTLLTSHDNLLPLCVQALDHHISTVTKEKDLVELGGLPLLMSVYQLLKDNKSVSKMLCRILTRICSHSEFLAEVFVAGWVGVLAEWLNSKDPHLSLLAAQCLANLDKDDPSHAHYGRHVVTLHPSHRHYPPAVDVVFVHGLLGGVLSTWRQRRHLDVSVLDTESTPWVRHSSDENVEEYLSATEELSKIDWEQLGSDYEFVVSDFPVQGKTYRPCHWYTLSGSDPQVRRDAHDQSYSVCWPKDWLSRDCTSIRVVGIDYESRMSEWLPTCSEKVRLKTLEERSATVLGELRKSGIGRRPIVWVAHSMGGLLVKKLLTDALVSCDFRTHRIGHNTKAIVFLSTPHLGCPLAKMNDVLNYLLWPSKEVEELRHNSDVLNKLHKKFRSYLAQVNVKIITFGEAKHTRVPLQSLGVDFHIVPPEFSHFDVGDVFEMPCDHECVAKPYNRLSFIYQTVLNLIKTVQEETEFQQ